MFRHAALVPLSRQHFDALALCVLIERSLSQDASEQNVARLAAKIGAAWDVELTNHFQLEEELIFPKLPNELATELLREHGQIADLISKLRTGPSQALLAEFVTALRDHAHREEQQYFPQFQESIPEQELEALRPELEGRVLRACLTDVVQ
jgi:hemerythrin superfamily protein